MATARERASATWGNATAKGKRLKSGDASDNDLTRAVIGGGAAVGGGAALMRTGSAVAAKPRGQILEAKHDAGRLFRQHQRANLIADQMEHDRTLGGRVRTPAITYPTGDLPTYEGPGERRIKPHSSLKSRLPQHTPQLQHNWAAELHRGYEQKLETARHLEHDPLSPLHGALRRAGRLKAAGGAVALAGAGTALVSGREYERRRQQGSGNVMGTAQRA